LTRRVVGAKRLITGMRRISVGTTLGSFGMGLVPGPSLLDWGVEIERLGFDVLFFRDHVLWHSPVLDPFTVLGALAARTSRIRLGPGVLLLPLRSPALVAKAIASLDFVSGGRAILGIGIGGEFPKEFEVCGVPLNERGRRADEGIEAIRTLWTRAPGTYKGQFVQFEDVTMEPRPLQVPHPPIWVGGRSDAALRRAGRLGDGWFAYFVTPQQFRDGLEKISRHRVAREPGGSTFEAGLVIYIHVAPSREEALRHTARYLSAEYRQSFTHLVERYCAMGPAGDCAAMIARFVEAGAGHITLIPACPPEMVIEQLRRIAAEILPQIAPVRTV
jgi:probable F420-dependent oxidoreductase